MAKRKTKGSKTGTKTKTKPPSPPVAKGNVACWEDDPGDPKSLPPRAPIAVSAPNPAAAPLPYKVQGKAPAVAIYEPGTKDFLYYATASALRRTADFWGAILPSGKVWEIGKVLPVFLDSGVDLNAFYTRGDGSDAAGLHFFHASVAGHTYYSGESPDVCCHEMGHAVLDAVRPQLFDANSIEAAAFHESFGDMSAMLTACQVESFRAELLAETHGTLNQASRLSRLAEQLGAAIRRGHPDAVDPDCLRNAANSFFYADPQTLPPSAPASHLCSEPHSFSRVFTAAFLDALAGMFKLQGATPSSDGLVEVSHALGTLLINAVQRAAVVPDYYSQVAAALVEAGEAAPFKGKYREVLKSAFVRRGILSLQAATTLGGVSSSRSRRAALAEDGGGKRGVAAPLPVAVLSAANFGLSRPVVHVHTAGEPKQLGVTGSAVRLGAVEPRSAQTAAEAYTENLFQRGHVEVGKHAGQGHVAHPFSFKSHQIVEREGDLFLQRMSFDCGWRG